ncbi:SdpA family antimicrobial peptide system protein [Microbacterium nymphoidis]|uniref:SdpA family antimicrobial peptide system protein n=1 Tax=Microbacterium nymphoidis TaxID=2898586 RepID=UPI003557F4DF
MYCGLLVLVFLVGGLYVGRSAIQDSAMRLPFDTLIQTRDVLPQGWAFFTRSPRESYATYWQETDAGWEVVGPTAGGEAGRLFGWQRSARSEALFGASLVAEASRSQQAELLPCEDLDDVSCIKAASSIPIDRSMYDNWGLCGEVASISREPVPWAWVSSGADVQMPAHVVRFTVEC